MLVFTGEHRFNHNFDYGNAKHRKLKVILFSLAKLKPHKETFFFFFFQPPDKLKTVESTHSFVLFMRQFRAKLLRQKTEKKKKNLRPSGVRPNISSFLWIMNKTMGVLSTFSRSFQEMINKNFTD